MSTKVNNNKVKLFFDQKKKLTSANLQPSLHFNDKLTNIFISITRELSVNRKDLQALTLVALSWENPALHVQHLDNQLNIKSYVLFNGIRLKFLQIIIEKKYL